MMPKLQGPGRRTLIILQPVLYEYRAHFLNGLSYLLPMYVITSLKTRVLVGECVNIPTRNPLVWFAEAINSYHRTSGARVAFVPAYTSHLGIVLSAVLFWFLRIPILVHGQSLYKKPRPSFVDYVISLFWLSIATRYLSYSPIGLEGPFDWPIFRQKVLVFLNRFESCSSLGLDGFSPSYASFPGDNTPLKLLFIGRDRPGSGLDLAVQLVRDLRAKGCNILLELIGINAFEEDGINCHGPLFSDSIVPIAETCQIGIYPGDAGLSVLHYMALGLCPIVHSDMRKHSGPEPAYVIDGITGCLFDRGSLQSLTEKVLFLYTNPVALVQLRKNAHAFSTELLGNKLSAQLQSIINAL
jgi:glycosyltransferase involved in cell wall biosynthesis